MLLLQVTSSAPSCRPSPNPPQHALLIFFCHIHSHIFHFFIASFFNFYRFTQCQAELLFCYILSNGFLFLSLAISLPRDVFPVLSAFPLFCHHPKCTFSTHLPRPCVRCAASSGGRREKAAAVTFPAAATLVNTMAGVTLP